VKLGVNFHNVVGIAEKIFKVMQSKVTVFQRRPWKCCELNNSWTSEEIWTKTYTNTYHSRERNWISFSRSLVKVIQRRPWKFYELDRRRSADAIWSKNLHQYILYLEMNWLHIQGHGQGWKISWYFQKYRK